MWLAFFDWKDNAIKKIPVDEVKNRIMKELADNHGLLVFHTQASLIKAFHKAYDKVIAEIKKEESVKL